MGWLAAAGRRFLRGEPDSAALSVSVASLSLTAVGSARFLPVSLARGAGDAEDDEEDGEEDEEEEDEGEGERGRCFLLGFFFFVFFCGGARDRAGADLLGGCSASEPA